VIDVRHATVTDPPADVAVATHCADVPRFTRLRYYHGRALDAVDLRDEQAYHLEKDRLRNRLLHGWGIVCGLDVGVHAEADEGCREKGKGRGSAVVEVGPGAAIDCAGNEVVVRMPRRVDLVALLGEPACDHLAHAPATVWLTLCYHEELIEPTRPLFSADCEPVAACQYARVCETYRVCVSTERPDPGPACEPCCGACGSRCLELAAIEDFDPGQDLRPEQIVTTGRRPLALHDLAEITAINWVHDGVYTREDATRLLVEGLEVRFSRPVQVASLRPEVVELRTREGGGGRRAGIYDIGGEFHDLPSADLTDRFVYRSTSDEVLQYGDLVTITVRGDFIVDECCRALDGDHIAGAVPTLAGCPVAPVGEPPDRPCAPRPSGDGVQGGDFVSWINVAERGAA
jgi:hypothetical protein